jgi:hypothetical protein
MQAFQDVDPSRQIEAFLVQMSIRIYWMERILGGGASAGDGMPVLVRGPVTERSESRLYRVIEPHLAGIRRHVLPLALAASTILAALLITGWLRRRARYQFPEIEVEPRLGGSHAAGVGAVISFASAALPPASQRDQVPDYLRRA